jgi:hypothetical protein
VGNSDHHLDNSGLPSILYDWEMRTKVDPKRRPSKNHGYVWEEAVLQDGRTITTMESLGRIGLGSGVIQAPGTPVILRERDPASIKHILTVCS